MSVIRLAVGCAAMAGAAGFGLAHQPELLAFARQSGILVEDRVVPHQAVAAQPRTMAMTQPAAAAPASLGTSLTLTPDQFGQYHATVDVQGQPVHALVDTGATMVALSFETAARLGIYPAPADFTLKMWTANGVARAAPVELPEVHLGPLVARHVKAAVSERGALGPEALLGMTFLNQLGGVAIKDGRLVLNQ